MRTSDKAPKDHINIRIEPSGSKDNEDRDSKTMVCRILVFAWPFGPTTGGCHAREPRLQLPTNLQAGKVSGWGSELGLPGDRGDEAPSLILALHCYMAVSHFRPPELLVSEAILHPLILHRQLFVLDARGSEAGQRSKMVPRMLQEPRRGSPRLWCRTAPRDEVAETR